MKLSLTEKEIFMRQCYYVPNKPIFPIKDFEHLKKYLFSYIELLPPQVATGNFANCISQPRFIDWVSSPLIMELVQSVLGPDLVLWSFGLCYKPPNSVYRVAAHIDSHYWMKWDLLSPLEVIGLFISMTEMTKKSGCFRLLPELNEPIQYKHKNVRFQENFFDYEIDDPRVDLSKMIDIEMKENQVCLTRENLIHASECNSSAAPRLGITLRFISGATKYSPHPKDGRTLYLLRGQDTAGNTYGDQNLLQPVGGFSWSTT